MITFFFPILPCMQLCKNANKITSANGINYVLGHGFINIAFAYGKYFEEVQGPTLYLLRYLTETGSIYRE